MISDENNYVACEPVIYFLIVMIFLKDISACFYLLYLQAMSSNYSASIEKTAASSTIIVVYTSYCLLMIITRQMY